jgi:hypothetical protein
MPTRLPPRREPRALALIRAPTGLTYAVADPWELRAAGSLTCRARALSAAVARVIRREKPTLLVAQGDPVSSATRSAARRLKVPLVDGNLPRLPPAIARDLYPEIRLRAPSRSLRRAAVLAIAAVLYAETPSRKYAPRCSRTPLHPA